MKSYRKILWILLWGCFSLKASEPIELQQLSPEEYQQARATAWDLLSFEIAYYQKINPKVLRYHPVFQVGRTLSKTLSENLGLKAKGMPQVTEDPFNFALTYCYQNTINPDGPIEEPSELKIIFFLQAVNKDASLLRGFPPQLKHSYLKWAGFMFTHEGTPVSRLNLQEMDLIVIPAALGLVSTFKQLDLCHNIIKHIPRTIGNLRQLTSLDFAWNKVAELPESLKCLENLTILGAADNRLKSLFPVLGDLPKLVFLDLGLNFFGQEGAMGREEVLNLFPPRVYIQLQEEGDLVTGRRGLLPQ